ncbi:MAG TPA: M23 family metallopeptidase [Flavobacterium sp.]|nr:M23 family metallopeptidase [Flavobacterium sp.]
MLYRCLIFFLIGLNAIAQAKIAPDFGVPINIPLLVSGSFGELRSDHFHSGVDFTANYKVGDPVYAPADGVINRIKVSMFGYGKALYLKHTNGYTTVYGHLNAYGEKIHFYVKGKQYQDKKFEIELFPLANELPIKKGEIIGYIGNTGGSGGPHLHYEIRNTESEHILNPLTVYLNDKVIDTEAPIISSVYVYSLTNETIVEETNRSFEIPLKKANGSYKSHTINAKGTIGFGINTYDTQNNSRGKNGIYKIVTYLNGVKTFEVVFDEFSFTETRHINHYIDYKYYKQTGNRIQKLFIVNDLPLSLIKTKKNNGVIALEKEQDFNYRIEVYDAHLNKQIIEIPLKYVNYNKIETSLPEGKYIDYLKDYAFEEQNVSVEWDARTFYEDVYLDIELKENTVKLHKDEYPVQKNINIKMLIPDDYPNKEQTFIGLIENKKVKYFDTWKRGNDFRIRTKELGTYQLVQDVKAPFITFLNDKKTFEHTDELIFEIEDDLSGIGTYNGFLNNEWILMEYDYKTKKLTHQLKDQKYLKGTNVLRVEVSDRVGNNTKFEQTIVVN